MSLYSMVKLPKGRLFCKHPFEARGGYGVVMLEVNGTQIETGSFVCGDCGRLVIVDGRKQGQDDLQIAGE